jgi:hypothetical protein
MIVSASYKTDIPAFYGAWFMARLAAGVCRMRNPYSGAAHEVPLGRAAVDGFVFWTRNAVPFLPALEEVRRRGYPFIVQYTITGYPTALERSVPEAARGVATLRRLAERFGPRAAVWRYDPILASSATPLDWHAENFARLASALAGAVDEVVISFAQIYRKTRRNLDAAAQAAGLAWRDPGDDEKRRLAAALAGTARRHGMSLSVCAQPQYLVPGAAPARCIDAARLSAVAGREIAAPVKGNRPGCLCAASRDIGAYDTCPHGCAYCYAVGTPALARRRYRAHDPAGEFLLSPGQGGNAPAADREPAARQA